MTQMSLQKRWTLQKRRQEVFVSSTSGVLQGEDKQKYTTTKKSACADIQATIETALKPFHQDKMCAL